MPDIFDEHKQASQKIKPSDAKLPANNVQAKPVGMFAAFSHRPLGITFADQEPEEEIVLFLRRHFATNIPWVAITILLALAPLFFIAISHFLALNLFTIPIRFLIIFGLFYYLVIAGYAFTHFISWFYNVGIVTHKRVVDIDSSNVLSQEIATANLLSIVDVEYSQKGFFQSFFNFGDIFLHTEGLKSNFEFTAAPKPANVTDIIQDLKIDLKGEVT